MGGPFPLPFPLPWTPALLIHINALLRLNLHTYYSLLPAFLPYYPPNLTSPSKKWPRTLVLLSTADCGTSRPFIAIRTTAWQQGEDSKRCAARGTMDAETQRTARHHGTRQHRELRENMGRGNTD